MKTSSSSALAICAIMVVVLFLGGGDYYLLQGAEAVTCDASSLAPCVGPILNPPHKPGKDCCDAVTVQYPCLCTFMKDPQYGTYVNSPGAKEVLQACNLKWPSC
ncbi:hypothetical protein M9H77_10690 [Catharanthus roseus]|uniref:Uncharacterized protein n=1 Tax=Catharanthus roseus TaxID=4058 RepID=A0ACC0BCH0_CATRO|nr:hypothetical protein M9H77_10690 [Catharanthus roseus]